MAQPTKRIEIDFANGPGAALSAASWTDVTQYVRSVRTMRGKQREQDDQFAPGSATVVLDNSDGRFDPNNTASPYAPNVLPMRRIRVLATDPSVTYDDSTVAYDDASVSYDGYRSVFVGYIREWPQSSRGPNDAHVTVTAVDAFVVLTNRLLPDSVWAFVVEEDAPDHWWRLAETEGTTAVDIGTAQSRDGTYSGGYTLGESGLVEHDSADSGVLLDGTGKLTIPAAALPTSDKCSVEIVVRIDALPATLTTLLTTGPKPGGDLPMMSIMVDDNGDVHVHSDRTDATGTANNQAGGGLAAGGTYHIMVGFTESAQSAGVYIDGSAAFTVGSGSTDGATSGDIEVGASVSHNSLQGIVSEVVFYDGVNFVQDDTDGIAAHASAVDTPWNGDTSGARVGRVLDLADWPSADRDVDTGQTTFGDANFNDDEDVLAYLNRCARSEAGHLFIDKSGQVRFIERHAFISEATYSTSQATFADADSAGTHKYHHLELDAFGVDDIYNRVSVQRKFGPTQTVEDSTSQASYLTRSLSKAALLMDTDAEARSAAEYLLTKFKDPRTKVSQMVFQAGGTDALWEQLLGRELMDRVTVQRDPPGAGDALSQEVHIIGIQHEIGPQSWRTTMWLSPADTDEYWVLGDSELSVLGSTTRVAY